MLFQMDQILEESEFLLKMSFLVMYCAITILNQLTKLKVCGLKSQKTIGNISLLAFIDIRMKTLETFLSS